MAFGAVGSNESSFARRLAAAASDLGRVTLPVVLVGWLTLYILAGKPNSHPGVYDHTIILQLLFAAPAIAYVGWRLHARRLPGPTPLDWVALGLIVAYAIAVAASIDRRVSGEASLLVATAVVVFYAAYDLKMLDVAYWTRAFVVMVAVIGGVAILTVVAQELAWHAQLSSVGVSAGQSISFESSVMRTRGVLDHPSVLAMFLNLLLPFAAARTINVRGSERTACALTVCVGLVALFFTLTRGAWLGTALEVPLFLLLVLLARSGSDSALHEFVRRNVRPLAVVAAVLLVLALALSVAAYQVRPDWLMRSTIDDRFQAARIAIAIFGHHWLTGAGPQTFIVLKDVYGSASASVSVLVHAHDIYLQVLSETGVIGALAVLAGVLVVFSTLFRAWRHSGTEDRIYLAACVSGLSAIMVHGFSDAPPSWNSIYAPLAIVLAVSLRMAPPLNRPHAQRARIPRGAVLGLVPLVLLGWMYFDQGHAHYNDSLRAAEQGRLAQATSQAVMAANADPNLFAYQLNAGVSLVQLYESQPAHAGIDTQPLDDGISRLKHGVELDPHSEIGYANLALALQLRGEENAAVGAAREAITDGPRDTGLYAAAGTVLDSAGLTDEATNAYAAALQLDPSLSQAPFWSTSPQRMNLRKEAISRAGLDMCEVGRFAALYGLYRSDLESLAKSCAAEADAGDVTARGDLALILYALGDTQNARTNAQMARSDGGGSLLSTAIVLSDDVQTLRTRLLKASAAGNKDATAMLLSTYGGGYMGGYQVLVPQTAGHLPAALDGLLPDGGAGRALQEVVQTTPSFLRYFSWGALREAPPVVLLPGDWVQLASPRLVLPLAVEHENLATSN